MRWLCNLYFDVELSARENRTGSEYDQRLDYAQEVLRLPPLSESALALEDGDAATRKKKRGAAAHAADRAARAEVALEEYRFSMQPRKSARSLRSRRTLDALEVVRRNLTAEIYATQWRTTSFVGQVMLTLSAFVLRHYVHYFGQLLYLYALGVPVTKFAIRESGVLLLYDTQQLAPYTEMAIVAIGMLSCGSCSCSSSRPRRFHEVCTHSPTPRCSCSRAAWSRRSTRTSCCSMTFTTPTGATATPSSCTIPSSLRKETVWSASASGLPVHHPRLLCSVPPTSRQPASERPGAGLAAPLEAQGEFFVPHDDEISRAELVRRASPASRLHPLWLNLTAARGVFIRTPTSCGASVA